MKVLQKQQFLQNIINSILLRVFVNSKVILEGNSTLSKRYSGSVLSCIPISQNKNSYTSKRKISTQNVCESDESSYTLKGWVRQITNSGENFTVDMYDGLSQDVSVVLIPKNLNSNITIGTSLVIKATKNDQQYLVATEVNVKGRVHKKFLKPFNFENSEARFIDIRAKFPVYRTKFRIRSKLKSLLHSYFQKNDYVEVDTPILSRFIKNANQETFYVEHSSYENDRKHVTSIFGHPVYLSTCGQLHLECISSALQKVYSMKPIFRRAPPSGKNLFEFWRADCEELYTEEKEVDAYVNMMMNIEKLLKSLLKAILDEHINEMQLSTEGENRVTGVLNKKWILLPYAEAMKILHDNEEKISYPVEDGMVFGLQCLRIFPEVFEGSPVFITDFPYFRKSFNVSLNENSSNVYAFDLIFPRGVEIGNGSVKEHDLSLLQERLKLFGALEYYSWFVDMRKWGVGPTRGFSIGIERFLYFMFNDDDIKNVIPYPRYFSSCKC